MSLIILPGPGTVTVTNGSATISGTNADFALYRTGYRFNLPNGLSVVLASDPTQAGEATITQVFTGITLTDVPYTVTPREVGSQIALEQRILSEMLRATDVIGVAASWKFSSVTADALPQAGYLRFNHATPASVTEIYVYDADSRGVDLGAWLDVLVGGQFALRSAVRPAALLIYKITAVSDEGGYRKLSVTYVSGVNAFSTDEDLAAIGGLPGLPGQNNVNWRGEYSGATAYVENDAVLDNGSSWRALQATTGNAPPVLPTISNANWFLMTAAGTDGAGTGDVVGPGGVAVGAPVLFDGTTGKLVKSGVYANQAEAEAGADAVKFMTPLRTLQAITENVQSSVVATVDFDDDFSVISGHFGAVLLVDATAGAVDATLLSAEAAGNGFRVSLKKTDVTFNVVTIDDGGGFTHYLRLAGQSVILTSDGTNWHVVAESGLVERGSNSDGEWVRWANGEQECRFLDDTPRAITFAWSGMFISAAAFSLTYPKAFVAVPVVDRGVHGNVTGAAGVGWHAPSSGVGATTTQIGMALGSMNGASVVGVNYTARGRWY